MVLWSRVSGLWSLVSGLGSLVSGLGSLASGLGSQVSGPGPLVSGLGSLVLGLWSLVVPLKYAALFDVVLLETLMFKLVQLQDRKRGASRSNDPFKMETFNTSSENTNWPVKHVIRKKFTTTKKLTRALRPNTNTWTSA